MGAIGVENANSTTNTKHVSNNFYDFSYYQKYKPVSCHTFEPIMKPPTSGRNWLKYNLLRKRRANALIVAEIK